MKLIIGCLTFCFGFLYFSGNNEENQISKLSYDELWFQVDSLKAKGLPKSALKIVWSIYSKAKAEKNIGNQTKSVFFLAELINQTEEEGDLKFYTWLKEELQVSDGIFKAILHSLTAETLDRIYSANSFKIAGRTSSETTEAEQITTWSKEAYQRNIIAHYISSIEDESFTQNDISLLDSVVNAYSQKSKIYTPTVYDFLVRRVLNYFTYNPVSVIRVEDYFSITDEEYFLPGNDFVDFEISSHDTMSYEFRIITLYKDYLINIAGRNLDELFSGIDLDRLEYVYSRYNGVDKDQNYDKILRQLQEQYTDMISRQRILASRAGLLFREGSRYNVSSDDTDRFRWKKKEALELLRNYVAAHPDTEIIYDFRQIFDQLQAHFLEVKVESVNLPDLPVLINFSFQNVDSVYVYLKEIPADNYFESGAGNLYSDPQKADAFILSSNRILTLKLPNAGDLQRHSTEYFLSGLPAGKYEILVVGKNLLSPAEKDIIAFSSFRVSDLAVVENLISTGKGEKSYIVFDRISGARIANAEVEIYGENYSGAGRSVDLLQKVKTDTQGKFPVKDNHNKNLEVIVRKNKSILHEQLGYSYSRDYENEVKHIKYGHIFTDRAIYRPGQTVFFKGVLYLRNSDPEKYPSLLKNTKAAIILRDANGKEVDRKQLLSDDFGGVHGQFNLPSEGLTGNFSLYLSDGVQGGHSIKVEEYKRPKFAVTFEEVKESIKLGEEINVKAKALYFSGVAAEGAAFNYKVVRKSFVPLWYRHYPSWMEQDESIVGTGEGAVAADGGIEVKFNARPRFSLTNVPEQFYNFEIIVDVIDINGETRTNRLYLPVSSVERFINASVDEVIFQSDLNDRKVVITSNNIQNSPLPAIASVHVHKLAGPPGKFIERYWQEPDTALLTKAEFRKLFPGFSYNKEDDRQKLPVEKTVLSKEVTIEGNLVMSVKDLGIRAPGIYRIDINDLKKEETDGPIVVFLEVLADKKPDSFGKGVNIFTKSQSAVPGETVEVHLTSPFPVEGSLAVSRTGKRYDACPLKLENLHKLTIAVTEEDRGGIDVHFFGIANNRLYQSSRRINVPWDNRQLTVTVEHFRDVVLPGAEEEYVVSVKNNRGEEVEGQLLASMYDASLDQFIGHRWAIEFAPLLHFRYSYVPLSFSAVNLYGRNLYQRSFLQNTEMSYDRDIAFKYSIAYGRWYMHTAQRANADGGIPRTSPPPHPSMFAEDSEASAILDGGEAKRAKEEAETTDNLNDEKSNGVIAVRENLNELVFFYPDMDITDGRSILVYKNNEALTEWKLQLLAIDSELGVGYLQKTLKTQKDLMVFPNWPRFLRQRDTLVFETRVNNLSRKAISAEVALISNDAVTGDRLSGFIKPEESVKKVTIEGGGFVLVKWEVFVPANQINPVEYIVRAAGEEQSDAERNVLPVLTNKVFITESLPMPLRSGEQRSFVFTKFKNNAGGGGSAENVNYMLEYTANPAWLAVQALPYLEEQKFNSTTAVFHRLYANALAKNIVDKKPAIKKVFDQWKRDGSDALLSNLSKNEEIKNILLEETPWVLEANSETEQKLNIARLFEFNRMSFESGQNLKLLKQKQRPDGGFAWFEEPGSNWYISQCVLSGFIHLHQLGAINIQSGEYQSMIRNLVGYLDRMIVDRYNDIKRQVARKNMKWENNHLSSIIVHYLYTRNAYSSLIKDNFNTTEYQFFLDQAASHWLKQPLFDQALIAIAAIYKTDKNNQLAQEILKSLKEKAFKDDEIGVYWAKMSGYYWNQSALSLQALMIELLVLSEDSFLIDDAITWLIRNKQTNHWKNSASTAEAIYALLLSGPDMLSSSARPEIKVGNEILDNQSNAEAGTGYFKKNWSGSEISPALANVMIKSNQESISWGALYWQYFEDIDKVESASEGPLKVERRLYKKVSAPTGEQLTELKNGQLFKGNEVVVRLIISVDRPMEFIHVKDQRASAFEPLDVISAYRFSGGLGYYQVTGDVSTSFFISAMNRGTYVLEYGARVFQDGNFSTGMTTIESMYAPEFKSHSGGSRYSR